MLIIWLLGVFFKTSLLLSLPILIIFMSQNEDNLHHQEEFEITTRPTITPEEAKIEKEKLLEKMSEIMQDSDKIEYDPNRRILYFGKINFRDIAHATTMQTSVTKEVENTDYDDTNIKNIFLFIILMCIIHTIIVWFVLD